MLSVIMIINKMLSTRIIVLAVALMCVSVAKSNESSSSKASPPPSSNIPPPPSSNVPPPLASSNVPPPLASSNEPPTTSSDAPPTKTVEPTTNNTVVTTNGADICRIAFRDSGNQVKKNFSSVVERALNSDVDLAPYLTKLNDSLYNFKQVTQKECFNGEESPGNFSIYMESIEFMLKNKTQLKELQQKGAFGCIQTNLMTTITECVKNISEQKNHTFHQSLFAKSSLDFKERQCGYTNKTEKCVLELVDKECNSASKFVRSSFDFVVAKYCSNKASKPGGAAQISAYFGIFILINIVLKYYY